MDNSFCFWLFKVGCNLILIVSLQPDTGRFVLFRDTPRFMMCKQSCENYPQLSSETIQNSVKALIGSRDIITCDCCFLSMKCHFWFHPIDWTSRTLYFLLGEKGKLARIVESTKFKLTGNTMRSCHDFNYCFNLPEHIFTILPGWM